MAPHRQNPVDESASPILDAMRRLDPTGAAGASQQPSLVRQLYALALLNREDARRRLHGAGMPTDMVLAQQPPSLLALSGPSPEDDTINFRRRPHTTEPRSAPAGFGFKASARGRRRFGAVSMSSGSAATCSAESALRRAREPSLSVTAIGAVAPPATWGYSRGGDRLARTMASGQGQHADADAGFGDMSWAPAQRSQTADPGIGGRGSASTLGFGGSSGFACGARGGSSSSSGRLGAAPLSASDLERLGAPVKVSTIPAQRALAQREAMARAEKELAEARLASPLPKGRLPVRMLLEADSSLGSLRHDGGTDYAALNAIARSTGPLGASSAHKRGGYGRGGGGHASTGSPPTQPRLATTNHSLSYRNRYVPDPRAHITTDPWKASEEDLERQRRGQAMNDDMAAVRRAAAVGYGSGVVPGFG